MHEAEFGTLVSPYRVEDGNTAHVKMWVAKMVCREHSVPNLQVVIVSRNCMQPLNTLPPTSFQGAPLAQMVEHLYSAGGHQFEPGVVLPK